MIRLRALGLLAGLTFPVACASIYGVTTLPSDEGTDAGADGAADARVKPKPDASGMKDAAHDGRVEASRDAGSDVGHDTGTDAASHDAGDGSLPVDGGADSGQAFFASVSPSPVIVQEGTSASLTVTLTNPAVADVQVTLTSLPSGVTAAPITINAGATSGMLSLVASASATEGTATATLTAGTATKPVDLAVAGASGSPDLSFNESGVQNFVPGGGSDSSSASCVAVQADGSILVGGTSGSWELVRLLADGSLDTAFNANVLSTTQGAPLPASGSLTGVAVIPGSGLIVLAGIDMDGGFTQLGILLLNTDGTRHQSFGTAGLYERGPSLAFHVTTVGGLAVDPTGTIAVAGNTMTGAYLITLSGPTNGTFAQAGGFPAGDVLQGVVYEPSGDLVVGGTSTSGGGQFVLTRFTGALAATGLVDGGVLGPPSTPSSGNQFLTASAIASDPAGNIFLVGNDSQNDPRPAMTYAASTGGSTLTNGYADPGPNVMSANGYIGVASAADDLAVVIGDGYDQQGNIAFVARITSAGTLDSTFATAGVLEAPASMTGPAFNAVAIDPIGRIVVVGSDGFGFYVTRIWP
jgi:uncharacterized delta-60 repeat protein